MDCQTHSTQSHCSVCLCKISRSYHRKKISLDCLSRKTNEQKRLPGLFWKPVFLFSDVTVPWKNPDALASFLPSDTWLLPLLVAVHLTTTSIIIGCSPQIYIERKKHSVFLTFLERLPRQQRQTQLRHATASAHYPRLRPESVESSQLC